MEVRAKKALGQHFLTDQSIAKAIVAALQLRTEDAGGCMDVLEIGPGMGVLSQYLLERQDVNLKMIEIDTESVEYLEKQYRTAVSGTEQMYLTIHVERVRRSMQEKRKEKSL